MSEIIKDRQVFSLTDVMNSVQRTLAERYKSPFWVKAEMNKLNFYKHSGHCYPDLVEKQDGKIIAQIRAILWSDDYRRIDDRFRKTLNEPLKDGIKILFQAKISFDASHGLTLRIFDIDPDYTLGDLEKEKQDTIRRLREEGIYTSNKALKTPLLPQRIAIISVETSKGYMDFLGKIDSNPWGYAFFHVLFPSVLQGDGLVKSVTAQLNRIRRVQHHFDVVAIVRGGGGEAGLAAYNNYELAREIALFPLPVLTGIGHITNETVTEMVAHKNLITPTDLADFILQRFHNIAVPVNQARQRLADLSSRLLYNERMRLASVLKHFRLSTEMLTRRHLNNIRMAQNRLADKLNLFFSNTAMSLDNMQRNVNNLNPKEVMRRGYSITMFKGRAVKSADELQEGDELKTVVYEGEIYSAVKRNKKDKDE